MNTRRTTAGMVLGMAGLMGGWLLAACSPADQQKAFVAGQLFCQQQTIDGPLIVALTTVAKGPVIATGQTAAAVAAYCAAANGTPVPPPPAAAVVPTMAVTPPAAAAAAP